MAERALCAIPARGGSKRLPRKNLLPLAGKPMIAWSIVAAIQSRRFERVYVCTDDREIAECARRYGAWVPFLMPSELCADLVSSHVPAIHLAEELKKKGEVTDVLVCLQPTSPLRTAEDIRRGMDEFVKGKWDFLVSVTALDPHYFHWAVHETEPGKWQMFFGDRFMQERPLLPPVFRPNGAIKIARIAALRQHDNFFGPRLGVIEMPEERSVHVGTRFELKLCEFLLAGSNP